MIEIFGVSDTIMGGAGGAVLGWLLGTRRTMKRIPRWSDMRLVRLTGERPDDYVETRDAGKPNILARLCFGRDYRYIVRRWQGAELVEDVRYHSATTALKRHDEMARR